MKTTAIRPAGALLLLIAAGWLAACGVDEHNPAPASPAPAAEALLRPLFSDPFESDITEIQLSTSAEYDETTDETRIFAIVQDQDGTSLTGIDFNAYNFVVSLQAFGTRRSVDPADTALSRELSFDKVVALVIDSSGSMTATTETGETRMDVAKEAARLFASFMGPGDRTAVVEFNTSVRTLQGLTDDQEAIERAIARISPSGLTNLGGALGEAVRAAGSRPGRRAAILITDGDDTVDDVQGGPSVWFNNPESSRFQGLDLAVKNGLRVYTVGLGSELSAEIGLADLQLIAEQTGGRFFQALTADDLLTVFESTIPDELESLPPMDTFLLTFPNPFPRAPGTALTVPFSTTIRYENANGTHSATASGSYTVQ
ncbi:MAG: hypothetical protein Kow0092_20510 [Deferrisomatales bacterium]